MTARIFWILGVGLFGLALSLMAFGAPESGGIIDYRAWLLLAFGILSLAIGNFSCASERGC